MSSLINLHTRYECAMVRWDGRYNMSSKPKTTALLMPFQCEFEVLMSYNFYLDYFEGTPRPKKGDVLRGWFPIQTCPELMHALSLNPKGGQYRGLVMSDLPYGYKGFIISDKILEREREERKKEMEKERKVVEWEKR